MYLNFVSQGLVASKDLYYQHCIYIYTYITYHTFSSQSIANQRTINLTRAPPLRQGRRHWWSQVHLFVNLTNLFGLHLTQRRLNRGLEGPTFCCEFFFCLDMVELKMANRFVYDIYICIIYIMYIYICMLSNIYTYIYICSWSENFI